MASLLYLPLGFSDVLIALLYPAAVVNDERLANHKSLFYDLGLHPLCLPMFTRGPSIHYVNTCRGCSKSGLCLSPLNCPNHQYLVLHFRKLFMLALYRGWGHKWLNICLRNKWMVPCLSLWPICGHYSIRKSWRRVLRGARA